VHSGSRRSAVTQWPDRGPRGSGTAAGLVKRGDVVQQVVACVEEEARDNLAHSTRPLEKAGQAGIHIVGLATKSPRLPAHGDMHHGCGCRGARTASNSSCAGPPDLYSATKSPTVMRMPRTPHLSTRQRSAPESSANVGTRRAVETLQLQATREETSASPPSAGIALSPSCTGPAHHAWSLHEHSAAQHPPRRHVPHKNIFVWDVPWARSSRRRCAPADRGRAARPRGG